MKIIKKGKPPSEQIWQGTCRLCGTVLQAARHELSVTYEPRDGTLAKADCPVCPTVVYFYLLKESDDAD